MAVARSYENYKIVSPIFDKNGKPYVKVLTPKGEKEVRWYTDSQRASMNRTVSKPTTEFNARKGFGFGEDGYILILRGNVEKWKETLPLFTILYNTIFEWYIPSKNLPINIPDDVQSYRLNWSEICCEDNFTVKDYDEIRKYIHTLIYSKKESKSNFQGSINEWLELDVTIIENIVSTTKYGESHTHVMEDPNKNVYIWSTNSKNLEQGKTFHIKMKVKEHKETEGIKQTVVWYCKIL